MASRAWATEVESANVTLVKVANKVFPKYSLYYTYGSTYSSYTYGSTYSRNGPYVPYMQYKMFTFIKLQ